MNEVGIIPEVAAKTDEVVVEEALAVNGRGGKCR
jgi:hypothetical protein